MGAQQSYVRGVSTNGGDRVSIFKLLLQFTTIGDTNEGNEGLTYLFRALLDTKIDDVSYEVLEVYLRNFVLHNLLNINLRHGKLYCYWDRYAALLEQIVKYESLAPLHPSDDTNGSIGCTTIPSGSTQRIIIEEILDSTSGGCDEPQLGGGLLHDGDCMAPTPDTQSQKPSEMFIVTNMADKSNSRLRKDGSAKITTHDGTDIGSYIGIVKGLSDPTRSLTLFVISKILFKCLIDTIDTAEILFHMDYLPYYLVPDALSFFNLDIAERKEAIPECTSEKPACHNISDDQVVDEADKCSDTICESSDEHSIASSSISIEAKSNNCGAMILRFCTEVHTITVEVPAGAAWKQVADGVIIEAAKTWSHGTMEALRRGFCLVDERMRIFSLQNIGFLFDHTKEHVEFMVLPFCISTYGSIGATSHLKRLLQALFTYITADIRPISSSHGIFLRASQSMAADVLVILLSCIVMKPYLCTTAKAELDSQFPPNFKWVKRAPTSTRSVAPLHYIYLDRIRSQLMLDRRSEVDQRDVHPVIDYAMNYGDNIKYGLLESFRFSIGRCGLETAARCLIRLLKSNAPNSSKRHLNNIRNHMVLLLLLLLNPTETDAFPYPESDGHSTPSMTTFTNSIYTSLPSNIAKVLKEADVKVPEVFCNQSSQQSSTAVVDRQLPLELLVELGKSLLDMGAPKVCSNELLLVLVDILSNNREFTSTFYARAHNFVREVINTIRRNSTISKQKKYSRLCGNYIHLYIDYEVTKAPLLRTLIRILTHYIRHHKVGGMASKNATRVQNHDIDNASLDMEHILQTIFDVFDW
ncbi:hypothetical protein X943_000079 [Babesia divergens]|uniref:Uncharacterized protein n=1 Tax=Babesia divergens TaxID=32595 RepID=A0AAD9GCH3_BABDI|nr:hypothetical protein X943_000079 [Babesia divergens]